MKDAEIFGHPRGLLWLCFAEFWERFSYYGMQSLLVLYMVHRLLLPGHVEAVLGFSPFRTAIESVYGPLSPQALASAIFGLYAGLVYLTPIGGGLLADRLLGRTRTVTLGAFLMAAGHFLMAFDASFLVALFCLLIGVGCFKGNIATQVGELYPPHDLRRADAFQIYLFLIQIAVIAAPIICGSLGELLDWHWGFAAAGIGMVIGGAIYLRGRAYFPAEVMRRPRLERSARPALSAREKNVVGFLILLVPVLGIGAIANQQIFNAYLIWGEANFRLDFLGFTMPITWLISSDAVLSAVTIAASVAFWRWWSSFREEPSEITKLMIGTAIGALGPLDLALAASFTHGGTERVSLGFALMFHIVNDLGFANTFPVGLALFSRASPKNLGGMMIGVYYLHMFIANNLVGWIGGYLQRMPAEAFWLVHFAAVAASTLFLLILRPIFLPVLQRA